MSLCPLCGNFTGKLFTTATDIEYFTTNAQFRFFECTNCSILFIHPVPMDQLKLIYPKNYYSYTAINNSLLFNVKNYVDSLYYKKIIKLVPGDSIRVLDIGGGTGTLLTAVKKSDSRINFTQIVDIDLEAQVIAQENGHKYFNGTIESFEDKSPYDVILMINLIEHVAQPDIILKKAASLLTPTGIIIIKTPNYKSLDARLFQKSYWGGLHCPRHWVLFTKKSITNLANNSGLFVNKFSYTQGAPFWSFSILHWLHKRKLIKANADKPLIFHQLFNFLSIIFATIDFVRKPFSPLSQMFIILKKSNAD
jgi:SAM-dependent methyltransferase